MVSLKQIASEGDKRNAALYTWLRYLVLLAAGSFAALLGLMSGKVLPHPQWLVLKAALLLHVVGILSGSYALYGEVFVVRHRVRTLGKVYIDKVVLNRVSATNDTNDAIFSNLPDRYRAAEAICYLSLLAALLCLAGWVCLL